MTIKDIFEDMDEVVASFIQPKQRKNTERKLETMFENDKNLAQKIADDQAEAINKAYEEGTLYEEIFGTDEEPDEIYNIKAIVDQFGEIEDVRIMVAFGGPNVWIFTDTAEVKVYWGTEASAPISYSAADEIREMFEYIKEGWR